MNSGIGLLFPATQSSLKKALGIYSITIRYLHQAKKKQKRDPLNWPKCRDEWIQAWGNEILNWIGIDLRVLGSVKPSAEPVLFVGNHISYLDIPVLMSQIPLAFIAKKELKHWPVFGSGVSLTGTVLVKRESKTSRQEALSLIAQNIQKNKQSVGVFPAGTTTVDERKEWRRGVFQMAHQYQIPVQPFRIRFEPLREVAYIDDDFFGTHLFRLLKNEKIHCTLEFHEPFQVKDPAQDCLDAWNWSRG